jgi:hypothetical protein
MARCGDIDSPMAWAKNACAGVLGKLFHTLMLRQMDQRHCKPL